MTFPTNSPPVPEAHGASAMPLGVGDFTYVDLFAAEKLQELYDAFDGWFAAESPQHHARFAAYRACKGEGMAPIARSEALLAAAPYVGAFVSKLFGVETEVEAFRDGVRADDPLWRFRKEFAKKRVLRPSAGAGWTLGVEKAAAVARAALQTMTAAPLGGTTDEERTIAMAAMPLFEVDDIARKAAKAGGAQWTDELRARARQVRTAVLRSVPQLAEKFGVPSESDAALGAAIALVLEALEAWLAARRADEDDVVRRWPSMHLPKGLDYAHLVEVVRPDASMPELIVGPQHERRQRLGFSLTDPRMKRREVEAEIDYCLLCHDRDKDSCSKGLVDAKTGAVKKNPLGVSLNGCPLNEKISEMHAMRQAGELVAAMALIAVDNPMCPGTGHRICNDCMKACIFQKQEPVNIPQVETRVLTETLALPWGLEIYQLLTRWNPLNVHRPYQRPYNGKNVLVVGLGPAGYTLVHHLACEGFGVVAVDGLKVEPLDPSLVGRVGKDGVGAPVPVRWASSLFDELAQRKLLGFGGVSEYGITVRWDKNFLTIAYLTLARNRNVRIYGGVRFGGTLTLDDAWSMGFDHVAISAGAGRPTIIDMKSNLARGIRKASDFLMALQLSGAYKHTSIANLQVSLPAIVIGGGLTAIDTATELLAYYQVQLEKELERYELLASSGHSEGDIRRLFDDEEWATLERHLAHARALRAEKRRALVEGREPQVQKLLDSWGGVTLVYRKGLADSPAYRLNHEEVAKSLEEGVRYVEHMAPLEAVLDEHAHVRGIRFRRENGSVAELPARTVCVAAGTSPNVIYEKEYPGTFELDERKQYFRPYAAKMDPSGRVVLEPSKRAGDGFFTSYLKDGHTVSFYGDNHPHYAGSVVRAMASAKDGFPHVVALFPRVQILDAASQSDRDAKRNAFFAKLDSELVATVHEVNRLTRNIVEIVVRAPMAARKFQPGQFYRLQNFETYAPSIAVDRQADGNGMAALHAEARLAMEGLALTGAWVDAERGLLGTIVLEMGGSSRLCAALQPGEPIVLMGPTGQPTEIVRKETVLLCGGGLGNAVLFSIARAFKAMGGRVLYFAGYRRGEDLFKREDIERWTDLVVWCTDTGEPIEPRRSDDRHFRGNIVQAMHAYASGQLGEPPPIGLRDVARIIAIGSDGMMNAVREARHGELAPFLNPRHLAIGSINSPMQCMMKEVCAQCLQKLRDPVTGEERVVFTCFNQDQDLDAVDFPNLRERLRANSMQEKLSSAWLEELLKTAPDLMRV